MIFTEDITILKLYLRLFVFYDFMKNKSMAKNSPSHFQIGVASESKENTFLHQKYKIYVMYIETREGALWQAVGRVKIRVV